MIHYGNGHTNANIINPQMSKFRHSRSGISGLPSAGVARPFAWCGPRRVTSSGVYMEEVRAAPNPASTHNGRSQMRRQKCITHSMRCLETDVFVPGRSCSQSAWVCNYPHYKQPEVLEALALQLRLSPRLLSLVREESQRSCKSMLIFCYFIASGISPCIARAR